MGADFGNRRPASRATSLFIVLVTLVIAVNMGQTAEGARGPQEVQVQAVFDQGLMKPLSLAVRDNEPDALYRIDLGVQYTSSEVGITFAIANELPAAIEWTAPHVPCTCTTGVAFSTKKAPRDGTTSISFSLKWPNHYGREDRSIVFYYTVGGTEEKRSVSCILSADLSDIQEGSFEVVDYSGPLGVPITVGRLDEGKTKTIFDRVVPSQWDGIEFTLKPRDPSGRSQDVMATFTKNIVGHFDAPITLTYFNGNERLSRTITKIASINRTALVRASPKSLILYASEPTKTIAVKSRSNAAVAVKKCTVDTPIIRGSSNGSSIEVSLLLPDKPLTKTVYNLDIECTVGDDPQIYIIRVPCIVSMNDPTHNTTPTPKEAK